MAQLKVLDKEGKSVDSIVVDDALIGDEINPQLIHDVIVGYLGNMRQGTSSTLTRGEVSASGKKPWRQKGTGRARAGSAASPLWRGGGVIFGPKKRDYRRRIPKRFREKALRGALASKIREGKVVVVDSVIGESGKTRDVAAWLKKIGAVRKPMIAVEKVNENLKRAVSNITGADVACLTHLNAYSLLSHDRLVVSREDFRKLQERLA